MLKILEGDSSLFEGGAIIEREREDNANFVKRKGGGDRAEIWANGDNRSAQVSSCLGDNREIPAVISVGWFRKPSVAALCEASLPTIRRTCPPVINFTGLSQVDRWMPISLSSSSPSLFFFLPPFFLSFHFYGSQWQIDEMPDYESITINVSN